MVPNLAAFPHGEGIVSLPGLQEHVHRHRQRHNRTPGDRGSLCALPSNDQPNWVCPWTLSKRRRVKEIRGGDPYLA